VAQGHRADLRVVDGLLSGDHGGMHHSEDVACNEGHSEDEQRRTSTASTTQQWPKSVPSRTSMFLIRVTMSATCNKPPPPHARAASTHSTLLRKGETRV